MPRPMPEAAPVTIATLPSSERSCAARCSIFLGCVFIAQVNDVCIGLLVWVFVENLGLGARKHALDKFDKRWPQLT